MAEKAKRRENGEGSAPRKRADGRWQVEFRRVDEYGKLQRSYVYGKTLVEVRAKAKEVRERLSKGQPAKDKRITLDEFTETWISSALAVSERKASTKTLYATLARKHVVGSKLGLLTLDRVKPTQIEAWVVSLREKGLSDSTIRQAYTILRAVLSTAVRDGAMAVNSAAAVTRPRVTKSEAAFLTPADVRRLLDEARGSRYEPLFELLVHTGLRRGEALALRWDDVDLDQHVLRVTGTLARVDGVLVVTEPKTTKSRRFIHVSPTVENLLRGLRRRQVEERLRAGSQWAQTGFVFTTEFGEPCDPRNALRALKVAADRAGLEGIGLHTLRHSAASTMLSNGVPLKVASEILGHSSISITADTYGHVAPEVAKSALDGLSDALG